MNTELKAKWVEALRSGEYAQCHERLMTEDEEGNKSFCCLGVLSEIMEPILEIDPEYENGAWRGHYVNGSTYIEDHELPHSVIEHIGITRSQMNLLMEMNDGVRDQVPHSFSEIADYIEKEL